MISREHSWVRQYVASPRLPRYTAWGGLGLGWSSPAPSPHLPFLNKIGYVAAVIGFCLARFILLSSTPSRRTGM